MSAAMPARINIDDAEITKTLRLTGGAVAVAAHLLGISPRTLQRRLKQYPTLWPDFGHDPLWKMAVERTIDQEELLLNTPDLRLLRAKKHFEDAVKWDAEDVELEPEQMSRDELIAFLAEIRAGNVHRVPMAFAQATRLRRLRAR